MRGGVLRAPAWSWWVPGLQPMLHPRDMVAAARLLPPVDALLMLPASAAALCH